MLTIAIERHTRTRPGIQTAGRHPERHLSLANPDAPSELEYDGHRPRNVYQLFGKLKTVSKGQNLTGLLPCYCGL